MLLAFSTRRSEGCLSRSKRRRVRRHVPDFRPAAIVAPSSSAAALAAVARANVARRPARSASSWSNRWAGRAGHGLGSASGKRLREEAMRSWRRHRSRTCSAGRSAWAECRWSIRDVGEREGLDPMWRAASTSGRVDRRGTGAERRTIRILVASRPAKPGGIDLELEVYLASGASRAKAAGGRRHRSCPGSAARATRRWADERRCPWRFRWSEIGDESVSREG